MNHTSNRLRLLIQVVPNLALLARVVMLLAATVPASMTGSPAWAGAVVIWLILAMPDRDIYKSLGLSHGLWNRHRQILLTLLTALVLLLSVVLWATTSAEPRPLFALVVFGGWLISLFWPVKPSPGLKPRLEAEDLASDNARTPRFSMSPIVQIVRLPQISAWMTSSALLALIIGLVLILTWLINFSENIVVTVVMVTFAMTAVLLLGAVSQSLRNWVAIGGARTAWAKETALIGLLVPMLAVLGLGLVALVLDTELFGKSLLWVMALSLVLPILVTLLELTDFRATWWITVPLVAGALSSSLLWLTGNLDAGLFLVCAIALYLIYGATLPAIARRWTPFGGGLTAWLGMGTAKAN